MKEIWKGVIYQEKDYSEFYEISNTGKLRNAKTKKEVNLHVNKQGYLAYCGTLGARGKNKLFKLHRCMAEAFIPKIKDKNHINHIDGDKLNNSIENLEWCTNKENIQHAWRIGLASAENCSGTKNYWAKLSVEDVEFIRKNYKPKDKNFGSRALGRRFSVDHTTISSVAKGTAYKYD